MRHLKTSGFILLVVTTFSLSRTQPTFSQGTTSPKKFHAKLKVVVSAPANLQSDFETYLKRHLRSISDVEVNDFDFDHLIQITAVEEKYVNGARYGFSVAVACARKMPRETFRHWGEQAVKEYADWEKHNFSVYGFPSVYALAARPDLDDTCKRIAFSAVDNYLQGPRMAFNLLKKLDR